MAVLLSCVGLVVVMSLHTYEEPIDRDIAIYAVIGHELLKGRSLYSDLWEHRPPAIFLSFAAAELLVGYGSRQVFFIAVSLSLIALAGAYRAGTLGGGRGAGLWATVFWALLSGDLEFQANQPNTEMFSNACLLWAFALLLGLKGDSLQWKRCLGIGALFALLTMYKSVAVPVPALLCAAHVLFPRRREARRSMLLSQVALMAGVGLAAWGALCGYYFLKGSFAGFYRAVFAFNAAYSGDFLQNLAKSLSPRLLLPLEFRDLSGMIAALLLAAAWGLRRRERHWALLVSLMPAVQIQLALQRMFYPHYYQLWLPVLVVGAAWALSSLGERFKGRQPPRLDLVLGGILCALLAAREWRFYHIPAAQWPLVKYHHDYFPRSKRLGRRLRAYLLPEETFFQWGYEGGLYFYSRKSPPNGLIHVEPALQGPFKERMTRRMLRRLMDVRPDLVVVSGWFFSSSFRDHPVMSWIQHEYRRIPGSKTNFFVLYARRGSDLEKRLLSPAFRGLVRTDLPQVLRSHEAGPMRL